MDDWKRKLENVINKWDKGPPPHLLDQKPETENAQSTFYDKDIAVRPKRRPVKGARKAKTERAKEREFWLSLENNAAKRKFKLIAPVLKVPSEPYQMYLCLQCQKLYQGHLNLKNLSVSSNLLNVFDVTDHKQRRFLLNLLAPDLSFINSRQMFSYPYKAVKQKDISWISDEVMSASDDVGSPKDPPQKRLSCLDVISICKNMAYNISSPFLRLVSWRLVKFFKETFSCICCQSKDILVLQETQNENTAILYLSLHKSLLDYIIVYFTLYCNNLKLPFMAIPDSMCIGPVSRFLLRKLGVMFVDENADSCLGKANHLILQKNMKELLVKNQSIQISVGDVDDAVSVVSSTVLTTVAESLVEGSVDDVIIVPVSVCYEKKIKSFRMWDIFKTGWFGFGSALFGSALFGMAHVCFGAPVSFQDFCARESRFQSRKHDPQNELCYYELYSPTSTKEVVDSLIQHAVADCNRVGTISCTSMVSFLLVYKHDMEASIDALEKSFEWLRAEVSDFKRYPGFDGLTPDVVRYALHILKEQCLVEVKSCAEGPSIVKVVDRLDKQQALMDYSRDVTVLYIVKAIIATCVIAVCGGVTFIQTGQRLPEDVSRIKILSLAASLCQLLMKEYKFIAPCCDIPSMLSDALDSLVATGALVVVEDTKLAGQNRQYAFDEEDDVGMNCNWNEMEADVSYEVNVFDQRKDDLLFLHSLLAPFLETVWFVLISLPEILKEEDRLCMDVTEELRDKLQLRINRAFTVHVKEASSKEIFHIMEALLEFQVIVKQMEDFRRSKLRLSQDSAKDGPLLELFNRLDICR